MTFFKPSYSKIILFFSISFFAFSLITYNTTAQQDKKTSIPECFICDYYGCYQAFSNQAGGKECSDSLGICYLTGGCCNNCQPD
jgi:hypothetical protein